MEFTEIEKRLNSATDAALMPYQRNCLKRFLKYIPVIDKLDILEIGGNGPQAVALLLNNLSGRKVVVCNPDPESKHQPDENRVSVLKKDACDTGFDSASFDIILGIAVLEHIVDMGQFARECFRLLRPNGTLFLQGGPLWHSRLGHHLFLVNQNMDYRFCGKNPVPDFAHLIYAQDELENILLSEKNIPAEHVPVVSQAVYASRGLNRLSTESICAAFVSVPTVGLKFEFDLAPPSQIVKSLIAKRGLDPEINYTASNMFLYARK